MSHVLEVICLTENIRHKSETAGVDENTSRENMTRVILTTWPIACIEVIRIMGQRLFLIKG